jgi:leader peptidase (prepilin peptidase) / N-methyltransferase
VVRWPKGESVLAGRSRCDSCYATIHPLDMVPVFSALWLRGRCRACGANIDNAHLLIEAMTALIGGVALTVSPDLNGLAGAVFGWLLLTLAALDLAHYWLPNALTGTMAGSGIAAGLLGGYPGIWDRLIGLAAGFVSLAAIAIAYRSIRKREGLGGGDPKMFGAIGAWLGWQALPPVLLGATVIGLSYVLGKLLNRKSVALGDRISLGALMALPAFIVWIVMQ